MQPTITKTTVGQIVTALVATLFIVGAWVNPPSGFRELSANPCVGSPDANTLMIRDVARSFVTRSDSTDVEWRTEFGVQTWTADSVVATVDSVVCTRIDSLITSWLLSPAGVSSGATKAPYWGPLVVVRLNPGKYYAWPSFVDNGWEYNFIVDSVGGDVRFFKSPW